MCSLCILDTNPLSNILFVNIFSQSLACLFIFLMAAFKKQIFWILMKTNILFFLLWIMFLVMIRSLCLFQIYKVFLLCFLVAFILLFLTYRSVIHFELIFVYGVWGKGLNGFSLVCFCIWIFLLCCLTSVFSFVKWK